jgi:ribosome-associated protein
MQSEITPVEISSQPIALCKLLKIANLVGGGGEAKIVISSGYVSVNQAVEYQKRKKVYDQDIIEFNGEFIQVICSSPVANADQIKQQKHKSKVNKSGNKQKTNDPTAKSRLENNTKVNNDISPTQRKPISF